MSTDKVRSQIGGSSTASQDLSLLFHGFFLDGFCLVPDDVGSLGLDDVRLRDDYGYRGAYGDAAHERLFRV